MGVRVDNLAFLSPKTALHLQPGRLTVGPRGPVWEKAPQQAADHQALDRATDRKSSDPSLLQGPGEQTVRLQLFKKKR